MPPTVRTGPIKLVAAKMPSARCNPIPAGLAVGVCDAYRKPVAPTIAPSLPNAPHNPLQVHRKCAGKSSAGRVYIVLFGPKVANVMQHIAMQEGSAPSSSRS